MTATVVLTLAGPMQSWGDRPRGAQLRPTLNRPTKSGVLGLIANACGRDWADDITDLAALAFGVRADRAGMIDGDYQTAGSGTYPLLPGEVMANPKWRKAATTSDPNTPEFGFEYLPPKGIGVDKDGQFTATAGNGSLTTVEYIADAVFTVALTGEDTTVAAVAAAADNPARLVYLGRRAYTPSEPILAGVTDHDTPHQALTDWPLHGRADAGPTQAWVEVAPLTPGSRIVSDQPVDYLTRTCVGRAELATLIHPADDTSTAGTADTVGDLDFFTDTP